MSDVTAGSADAPQTAPETVPETASGAAAVSEEFVRLFTKYQRRIFLFILAQVGDPLEAEELQQQTNVVLWSKFSQFEPGTNFLAWAFRIARYEIMNARSKRRSDRHVFSDAFLEQVSQEIEENAEYLERRRTALLECLRKLRAEDRDLIERRYAPGASGKSVAEALGRPINAVYQSLSRIRRALFECVNRRLAADNS